MAKRYVESGLWVPFRWDIFLKKQRVIAAQNGLLSPVPAIGFHLAILMMSQIGWAVDGLLPSKMDTPSLSKSVFIVGHQRSGTTFLHRLLGHNDWAQSLNLHEMLLPANSIQGAISAMDSLDNYFGGFLRKGFSSFQQRSFGHLDDIHRVRFDEPEEDELVMWAMYASDMCINDNPTLIQNGLDGLPKSFEFWSATQQKSALIWYRKCVQKKLQRSYGEGLYIGKNPRFSRCLPLLDSIFPNSKIIVLIRDPIKTIVSRMSLMKAIWNHRDPSFGELTSTHVQWILQNSIETYLKTEEGLGIIPKERRLIVGYNDLKTKTRKTVHNIIDHLDLPQPSSTLLDELNRLETQEYHSSHDYDLSQFGLDESDIKGPLSSIFEKYQDQI